jgi:hypothetical protein
MTPEEHKLIVMMMAQQYQRIMALTEALISKGHLDRDDLTAYEELVRSREQDSMRQFVQIAKQYEDFAEGLGINFRFATSYKEKSPSDPPIPE